MILGLLILFTIATILVVGGYLLIVCWNIRHPERQTAGWALAHHWPPDPNELELPFEEWTLDAPDGVRLPVWDIPSDGTPEERDDEPVLVVLHGWGRSRIDSLARIHRLLTEPPGGRRGFRTLIPELRGHGDASKGPTTLGAREVEDIISLLETVRGHPVILLGHSLGAVIALHVAAARPDQVRSVIALAPYDRVSTPFDGYLTRRDYPGGPLARALGGMVGLLGCRMRNTIDVVRDSPVPTAIMVGARDTTCPPQVVRAIAEASPSATFEELPEAAHSNHHRTDPARMTALLTEALERTSDPRQS